MILHSLNLLHMAGFSEFLLVTNAENVGDFMDLLSSEVHPVNEFKQYYVTPQRYPDGIADAIRYGEGFAKRGPVFVLLGDNVFEAVDVASFSQVLSEFKKKPSGAHVWTATVPDPRDYGVLGFEDGKPTSIVEKPKEPPSHKAVVGAYLFDEKVWDILPTLVKSDRGEYEITDIIREYLINGSLVHHELHGAWHDLGRSVESYYEVASRMI